jgi:hypothetical protein
MADKQQKSFIDKLKNVFTSKPATKKAKAAMLTPYEDKPKESKPKEKTPNDENKKLKNKFGF